VQSLDPSAPAFLVSSGSPGTSATSAADPRGSDVFNNALRWKETLKSFNCKLFNVSRINNELHELHHVLDTESLDILCITETWLKPSTPDSLLISGISNYSVSIKDRTDCVQGGGVCIIANCNTVKAIRVEIDTIYTELMTLIYCAWDAGNGLTTPGLVGHYLH